MTKYIAYCRKSRDEADKQVLSIEAQIAELKEFAEREHLEIVEFIEEAKTAKMPGREKFSELIKKIEKGYANGIFAWHPDRLARNSMDGGKIIYLLDTGKLLDLKFPTFWFDNTPQGKFMLSIAFGQSKYYVDNLSENVKRGQRQKLRNGVWPSRAPIGYLNNPKTRGIDIDVEKSKVIKKAFELFSYGNKSFTDIALYLYKFGVTRKNCKPLHLNEIRKFLTNKFYIGIMYYGGEYHQGIHECFIDKDIFSKAQEQIRRISKPRKSGHDFVFKGLARCGECGAAITAETHTKYYKTTKREATYNYYRCTHKLKPCQQKPISESDFETQLRNIISERVLPKSWVNDWLLWLERDEGLERQNSEENIQKLKMEEENLNKKANILLDSFLDQIIDSETYKQKKNEIFEKKLKIQEEITKIETQGSSWVEPMREFISVASELEKTAREKNNPDELAFIGKRVGSNFFLKDRRISVIFSRVFDMLRAPQPARSLQEFSSFSSVSVGATRFVHENS